MSAEHDPFYLRYNISSSSQKELKKRLPNLNFQILVRPSQLELAGFSAHMNFFQHWTFRQAWPRIPRVRVLPWPSSLRKQFQLPK